VTLLHHLLGGLVIAAGGVRFAIGSAAAHGGVEHSPGAAAVLGHGDGLGLMAVILLTGAGYWLMNRTSGDRPIPDRRGQMSGGPESGSTGGLRATQPPSRQPVADRRLGPPRRSPPSDPRGGLTDWTPVPLLNALRKRRRTR
jgi:hypothetical protein